jgi:hypothetical protein
MLALFITGESFDTLPVLREMVGFLFFPVGISIGMILGWKNEFIGGLIAVASLAFFYVWNFIVAGYFPTGPWFLLLVAPGFLFLIAGIINRTSSP